MSQTIESAVPASGTGLSGLASLAMLSDKTSDRMRKLIGTYMVGMTCYRIAKKYYDKAKAEATYTLSVAASDDIYPDVQVWLLDQIPEHKRRALSVRSSRANSKSGDWAEPIPLDSVGGRLGSETAALQGRRSSRRPPPPADEFDLEIRCQTCRRWAAVGSYAELFDAFEGRVACPYGGHMLSGRRSSPDPTDGANIAVTSLSSQESPSCPSPVKIPPPL
jgi:hypothetical protein